MYSIIYSQLAEKQLSKVPSDIQRRVIATIERCRIRPYVHVKRLVGSPYYRLRVGDYRVIMDIINNELNIFVIEVAHRSQIYDKEDSTPAAQESRF